MLKDLHFSGIFHDNALSVNITLENPTDYGFDASVLLLSVMVKNKIGCIIAPVSENFTFYIMDETNRLYNTQSSPTLACEESTPPTTWLIHTDFQYDFLFQNLRIAFFHPSYENITVIELRH